MWFVVHVTFSSEPDDTICPFLGDVMVGVGETDAARTRAVRRAVKSCIANVVEYVALAVREMNEWNVV